MRRGRKWFCSLLILCLLLGISGSSLHLLDEDAGNRKGMSASGVEEPEAEPAEAPVPSASPAAVPSVKPTPEEMRDSWVREAIASMSLEEKVGQLFFVTYRKDFWNQPVLEITDAVRHSLEKYQPGGICLFGENIDTAEQTSALLKGYRENLKVAPFLGVDEEGGSISRLHASGKLEVEAVPKAGEIGRSGDPDLAYASMQTIAGNLKTLGFNLDFAPVADICTNPQNPVIGDRAYGTEPKATADMMASALHGLMESGVIACVKHFPGHGDTTGDTHKGAAAVQHDLQRLRRVEFVPFRRAIAEGVPLVMVAHIKTPNATGNDLPASLSEDMVTGLLREELGFEGIIITDAMDMKAIADHFSPEEAAVAAVMAGVDMVLMPADLGKAYDGVLSAAERGEVSEERLEESLYRILSAKYDAGLAGNRDRD